MENGMNINVHIGGNVEKSQVITGRSVRVDGAGQGKSRESAADKTGATPLDARQLQLFETLRAKFNLEGVELICWEMGIRFDDLPGAGLTAKARELVQRAAALNLLDTLSAIAHRERPDPPPA